MDPSVSTPQGPDPSTRRQPAGRSARKSSSHKVAEALSAAVELKDGGLRIERRFTREGLHPFDEVAWEKRWCSGSATGTM